MAALQNFLMGMTFLLCLFSAAVVGRAATATFYDPPYTPSACFESRKSGVMIAAASSAIWNNRAACGKKFRVTCLGKKPYPCKANKEIVITIVDFCPRCGGTIDLSREAFGSIAALKAGRINIKLQPL